MSALEWPDDIKRDLVSWDLWSNHQRRMNLADARREDCPCCRNRHFPHLDACAEEQAVTLCGRNAVQIVPPRSAVESGIDLPAMAARLSSHGEFTVADGILRGRIEGVEGDEGSPVELTLFADGRAIVGGSIEPEFARNIYARFVGQ